MYRGVTVRLYHKLDLIRWNELLAHLKSKGADAIAIIPHEYCIIRMEQGNGNHDVLPLPAPLRRHAGQYFFADLDDLIAANPGLVGNTTPPDDVRLVCQTARDAGFHVLLKPHVDPLYWHTGDARYYPGGWRGNMQAGQPVDDFRKSYCEDFLATYVGIAQDLSLPLLSLGVEYVQITRDEGAAFWVAVADWVAQQGYSGALTYAANWGWGGDAEFRRLEGLWRHPQVGYIGIDAYYHLWPIQLTTASAQWGWSPDATSADAAPDLNELLSGWDQPHLGVDGSPLDEAPRAALLDMNRRTGKPLLFTEIGYSNRKGANWEPGREPNGAEMADPPNFIDDPTVPGSLQERLFEAFRQTWAVSTGFAGYFWWEASLDPAADPRTQITHNIVGTNLENLVFKEFVPADPQLKAPPNVDKARFAAVLQAHNSPALDEAPADAYYDLCVAAGVDPALALAFFGLEADYGNDPVARPLKNWSMLWDRIANKPATYPTWQAGLADWLRRVQGPAYLRLGPPTLGGILPIYRPLGRRFFAGDLNRYGDSLRALLSSWQD